MEGAGRDFLAAAAGLGVGHLSHLLAAAASRYAIDVRMVAATARTAVEQQMWVTTAVIVEDSVYVPVEACRRDLFAVQCNA